MRNASIILFCATLCLAGCKSYGPRFDPYDQPAAQGAPGTIQIDQQAFEEINTTNLLLAAWLRPPTNFFTLGPGDVVEIEQLGEAGARATALVGPDGKIYYSLLPGMFVWGLTLSDTKSLLETNLARFVRVQPEIGLTLRSVGSKRIWVLGGVVQPGVYHLGTPTTLLEAISAAGGTTFASHTTEEQVDLRNSFVMRQGELLRVDLYRLLRLGDLSQNIYLQPDDFIYLRPAPAREVYVLGAVVLPNIVPYSPNTSLVSALASAGGTLPYAYSTHVGIIRGSLSQPFIAVVDYKAIIKGKAPDVRLRPGDVVYVPFAPYKKLAQFADLILNQFVRTIAINEGRNAVLEGPPVPVSVGVGVGF